MNPCFLQRKNHRNTPVILCRLRSCASRLRHHGNEKKFFTARRTIVPGNGTPPARKEAGFVVLQSFERATHSASGKNLKNTLIGTKRQTFTVLSRPLPHDDVVASHHPTVINPNPPLAHALFLRFVVASSAVHSTPLFFFCQLLLKNTRRRRARSSDRDGSECENKIRRRFFLYA